MNPTKLTELEYSSISTSNSESCSSDHDDNLGVTVTKEVDGKPFLRLPLDVSMSHTKDELIKPCIVYKASHISRTSTHEKAPQLPEGNTVVSKIETCDAPATHSSTEHASEPSAFNQLLDTIESIRINVSGELPSLNFIKAMDSLVNGEVLNRLGACYGIVQRDMSGNITKLRKIYNSDREANNSLQLMIAREIDFGTIQDSESATVALLWLTRALEVIHRFIELLSQNLEKVSEEQVQLGECFRQAYMQTLSKHHNFLVRGIVSTSMSLAPSLSTFLGGTSDDIASQELKNVAIAISHILDNIQAIYRSNGLE